MFRTKLSPERSDGQRPLEKAFRECRQSSKKATILIVDDPSVAEITARVAEHMGHKAEKKTTGREAVERYMQGGIDLVISGFKIRDMNGLEILKEIKKHDPDAAVVIATSGVYPEEKEALVAAGVREIAIKPFEVPRIIELIKANI